MKKIINVLLVLLVISLFGGCLNEGNSIDDELELKNSRIRTGYINVAGNFEKITYIKSGEDNIFEGDIHLEDEHIYTEEYVKENTKRGAISYPKGSRSNWGGRVRYYLDSDIEYKRQEIEEAVQMINANTNVVLEEGKPILNDREVNYGSPIIERDLSYIRLFSIGGDTSHSSSIGNPFYNGAGGVGIALTNHATSGTVVHEFLHALGMWHEMSRTDRDNYVTIHWNNIKEEWYSGVVNFFNIDDENQRQFAKHGYSVEPFNIDSIMMYHSLAFSKNSKYTITIKGRDDDPFDGDDAGYTAQRERLATSDINTLNYLFPNERVIYRMTVSGYSMPGSHKTPSIPTGYYYSGPGSLPDLKTGYTVKGKNSTLKIKSLQTDLPMYKDAYEEVVFERGIYKGESFYIDACAEKSGNGRRTFVFFDQYGNSFGTQDILFDDISNILAGNTNDKANTGSVYMGPYSKAVDNYLEFYFDGNKITYSNKTK